MKRTVLPMVAAIACGFSAPAASQQAQAPDTGPARAQIGVEERVRSENWDNIIDHSDAQPDVRRQWRFRTRIWADLRLGARVDVHVGLNNESRAQITPHVPFGLDETLIDRLYVDARLSARTSVRAGRQDIARGEGFVLFDGTPMDGSRTAFVNGVDVVHQLGSKSRLEGLALLAPPREDSLPVISNKSKPLLEESDRLLGAYYSDTRLPGTDLQVYGLYKSSDRQTAVRPAPLLASSRTTTIGTRLAHELGGRVSAVGELAGQWGRQQQGAPIRAWGGYVMASRPFHVRMAPTVGGGYVALSGDDPATATIEGWDPLFGRWPKWSESYIYSLAVENGPAYWTNLRMWRAEVTCVPVSPVMLRATYYRMGAEHPEAGHGAVFGNGNVRGDLLEARADATLTRWARAHVLYERLAPGSFYAGTAPGYFFRVELVLSYVTALDSHSK